MKFVFHTTEFLPTERPFHFQVVSLTQYDTDFERAKAAAKARLRPGFRIWCSHAEPENSCTMCGGVFHEATGHWESVTRHWCGPCTRSMVKMLKEMLCRKWGGVRFYDTAPLPLPGGLNDPDRYREGLGQVDAVPGATAPSVPERDH